MSTPTPLRDLSIDQGDGLPPSAQDRSMSSSPLTELESDSEDTLLIPLPVRKPSAAISSAAMGTQTDALPPPPQGSESFAHLNNRGSPIHDKWIPISSHTAKCDKCMQHNKSVCQRCLSCNRQLCRRCMSSMDGDNIHFFKEEDLDWTPPPPPKRLPRAAPSVGMDRLNTTGRRTAAGPSAHSMRGTPGGEQGQGIVRPESFLDEEESFLPRGGSFLPQEQRAHEPVENFGQPQERVRQSKKRVYDSEDDEDDDFHSDPNETEDDVYVPSPQRSKTSGSNTKAKAISGTKKAAPKASSGTKKKAAPKSKASSGVKKAPSKGKSSQAASAKRAGYLDKATQTGALETQSLLDFLPRTSGSQLPPGPIAQREEERREARRSHPVLRDLLDNGWYEEAEEMLDAAEHLRELSRGGGDR